MTKKVNVIDSHLKECLDKAVENKLEFDNFVMKGKMQDQELGK